MTLRSLLVGICLALAPHAALAQSKTVVLSVPDMYSPACPVLARKALQRIPGVQEVQASLERKEAVVVFDAERTDAGKLVEAAQNAGFPNARIRD